MRAPLLHGLGLCALALGLALGCGGGGGGGQAGATGGDAGSPAFAIALDKARNVSPEDRFSIYELGAPSGYRVLDEAPVGDSARTVRLRPEASYVLRVSRGGAPFVKTVVSSRQIREAAAAGRGLAVGELNAVTTCLGDILEQQGAAAIPVEDFLAQYFGAGVSSFAGLRESLFFASPAVARTWTPAFDRLLNRVNLMTVYLELLAANKASLDAAGQAAYARLHAAIAGAAAGEAFLAALDDKALAPSFARTDQGAAFLDGLARQGLLFTHAGALSAAQLQALFWPASDTAGRVDRLAVASLALSSAAYVHFPAPAAPPVATPGALVSITWPAAQSLPGQAVSYAGAFAADPSGPYTFSAASRTLSFVPSAQDVRAEGYTFTVTASDTSGGKTSRPVTILVRDQALEEAPRLRLSGLATDAAYRPVLGPFVHGGNLYLVAEGAAGGSYRLEQYPLAALQAPAAATLALSRSWSLPRLPADVDFLGGRAYLAYAGAGAAAYDLANPDAAPVISASLLATSLECHATGVYALHDYRVRTADLGLGAVAVSEPLSLRASAFSATTLAVAGDRLFISNGSRLDAFALGAAGPAALAGSFAPASGFGLAKDASGLERAKLYARHLYAATVSMLDSSASSLVPRAVETPVTYAYNQYPACVNGPVMYQPRSNSGVLSFGLDRAGGLSSAAVTGPTFQNAAGLHGVIVNLPEGQAQAAGRCASYVYFPCQYTAAGSIPASGGERMTGTWHLQGVKVSPAP